MNWSGYRVTLLSVLINLLLISLLSAGGPNVIDKGGAVYRWEPGKAIPFSIDQGFLGDFSEEESITLVQDSIRKWADVPTSSLDFVQGERLDFNITVNNYREFFGLGQDEEELRPENPVIFDDNGAIIEDYLGQGASKSILGFSGIRFADRERNEFLSAWVVINGAMFEDLSNYANAGKVITHELGHLIGLDHSQGLPENYNDPEEAYPVPLMYPIVNFNSPEGPVHDDITWISWLYPTPEFSAQAATGTIRGKVLRPTGDPLLGANVIARRYLDGELLRSDITSVASGFLMLEQGEFELPGLEPGDYAVCIEPINSYFTGGSGIGPYDQRPMNFPRDYFDADESAEENPGWMEIIHVSGGDTRDGLVIIANEYTRELNSLSDDDEVLFAFPDGFSFPFYGNTYRSVYVSSDGVLSFRIGDQPDGSFRSESRFIGGPPRISPLYTDLDPGIISSEVGVETGVDGDTVTFYWKQVPEYSYPAATEGNTFSVSLSLNGDIWINYGEINLTPDFNEDYPEGLNAIVGIVPGGLASGVSGDLSGDTFYTVENGGPVYEVFTGSSFDLEHLTIGFNAARARLFFPFIRETSQEFTGYALTAFGSGWAELDFEARDKQGFLRQDLGINPARFDFENGTQFSRLSREIFGTGQESLENLSLSWTRVLSSLPDIGSFVQIGNGLGSRQTRMDGASAFNEPSTQLIFTRIYQGDSAYPVGTGTAWAPATTSLSLANPEDIPVDVRLSLYSGEGELAASEVSFAIAPLGYYSSDLTGIFSDAAENIRDGFIRVTSSGRGVVGFEFIELADTCIGLNGAVSAPNRILYSAQLAHHETIYTSLKLVNPTQREISFFLKAYLATDGSGTEEITSSRITLLPNQSFQQNVDEIFELPPFPDRIMTGSIQVIADWQGLLGDVIFGDPVNASYAAALPLQGRLFTSAVQSHISNGRISWDSTQDAFTGLAVFNPGVLDAAVRVTAFGRDGLLAGETTKILEPGGRIARTLVELVPATDGMSGGFVMLESSRPIVAQQLFGNAALDYMSAVPPWIIE